MCTEESLRKAKNGQALIISKSNLFLTLLVLVVSVVLSFASVKFESDSNCDRIEKLEKKYETIHEIDSRLIRIETLMEEISKKLDSQK